MNYKLKIPTPEPTADEREICEAFAKARAAAAEADELKDRVQHIVEKYGNVTTAAGLLTSGESVRYPVPTLTEWQSRVDALRGRLEAAEELKDAEAAADLRRQLERIDGTAAEPGLTGHLKDWWEVAQWTGDIEDYLKATGVVQKVVKPTVKFVPFRPKPKVRKVDHGKN